MKNKILNFLTVYLNLTCIYQNLRGIFCNLVLLISRKKLKGKHTYKHMTKLLTDLESKIRETIFYAYICDGQCCQTWNNIFVQKLWKHQKFKNFNILKECLDLLFCIATNNSFKPVLPIIHSESKTITWKNVLNGK